MQTRLVDIIEMTQRKAMSNCIALQSIDRRPYHTWARPALSRGSAQCTLVGTVPCRV